MAVSGALDRRPVRDRADDMGVSSGRDVGTDRNVASRAESGSEKPTEPSGRTGEQNAHHKSFDVPGSKNKKLRSIILLITLARGRLAEPQRFHHKLVRRG